MPSENDSEVHAHAVPDISVLAGCYHRCTEKGYKCTGPPILMSPAVPCAYGHVIASILAMKVAALCCLGVVIVAVYWLVLKLVVVPVEGLLCMNGWWVELRLTAGFTFVTIQCGKVFDCMIPMWMRFPQELHAHAVVVQIVEMDASECV
ncbi:hypothetical protein EI94DRAFT_1697898 [Lactarius quietus]|nr:hypothetical protein EI94DRAFT_1697898 [Lactarius quietus]